MGEPEGGTGADRPLPVLVVGRAQRLAASLGASKPAISADGRYVAFVSDSPELVPGDANDVADVFVRDVFENTTVLVSRSLNGGTAAGASLQPSISADGQVVAFTSSAPDLVPGDANGTLDVFVHDLRTGEIELVSRGSDGSLADNDSFSPSLSADGRFVAFSSLAGNLDARDTNNALDVYLHDRQTGRTTLISAAGGVAGDGPSGQPSVSGDGKRVAFASAAHLHPDDTNDTADVYVHDVDTGAVELVSRTPDGGAAHGSSSEPSISADGHAVAFTSSADDLVPDDDNEADDVFVHDVEAHETRLVSRDREGSAAAGPSHAPSISADGHRVAFLSSAPGLTPADPPSDRPSDRPTGSPADPLTGAARAGDRGYVRDLDGAGTALLGYAAGRAPADGETASAVISGSGEQVAFIDGSTNLSGQEPTDGGEHVYVARLTTRAVPQPAEPAPVEQEQDH